MDDYALNSDASFYENIKKGMHNRHPKAIGPKPTSGKFSPFRVHSKSAELAVWTPLLGFLTTPYT